MARADSDDSIPAPAKPQDALYLPVDMTPEEIFRAIGKLRKDARDEIDRLIRFLDETENHMELEDDDDREPVGDDEPSLGSFDRMMDQDKSYRQVAGWLGVGIDTEQDDCDREDDDPDEAKQQPAVM